MKIQITNLLTISHDKETKRSECTCTNRGVALLAILAVFCYAAFILLRPPARPVIDVTHATLNQFNFTNGNTLRYDLHLNVTASNPNKNYGIHYNDVRVTAFAAFSYEGNNKKRRFAIKNLDPFYQGKKASTTLPPLSFRGQQMMILSESKNTTVDVVVEHLCNPNPNDVGNDVRFCDIVLEVYFRDRFKRFRSPVAFKGAFLRSWKQKSTFVCDLKVPLIGSGGTQSINSNATFETTRCVRSR